MSNPKTIAVAYPDDKDIDWFVKNIGPRTHFTKTSVGGIGWRYNMVIIPGVNGRTTWELTIDDEKMLVFYLLQK